LAQRLVEAGEHVVDVPPTLAARVRLLGSTKASKNDSNDALATAIAGWPAAAAPRCGHLHEPRAGPGCADRPGRSSARRHRSSCGRCRQRTPAPAPPAGSRRPPSARPQRSAAGRGVCPPRCSPRSPRSEPPLTAKGAQLPEALSAARELPARQDLAHGVDHHHGVEPLVRVDTDHHPANRFLLAPSCQDAGRAALLRAWHSPLEPLPTGRCSTGSDPFASHTQTGWAARSRANPPSTSAQGWPAPNLAAIQTSSPN
jgi:hypothetical protein